MFNFLIIPLTLGTMLGGILTILWLADNDNMLRNIHEAIELIIAPQMFVYKGNRRRLTRTGLIILEVMTTIVCFGANIILFFAVLVFKFISLIANLYLKIFKKRNETL